MACPATPRSGLPVLSGHLALGGAESSGSGCLTARGDVLLELADAVWRSDRLMMSLMQLSLVPEFRHGHGTLRPASGRRGSVDGGVMGGSWAG
jgi:hypothetical protein